MQIPFVIISRSSGLRLWQIMYSFEIMGSIQLIWDRYLAKSKPIMNYLSTLPGYQKGKRGQQVSQVFEQHGYILWC